MREATNLWDKYGNLVKILEYPLFQEQNFFDYCIKIVFLALVFALLYPNDPILNTISLLHFFLCFKIYNDVGFE